MYTSMSDGFVSGSRIDLNYSSLQHAVDAGSQLRQWSSLIGIITAIVGNILISFALNVQRYAHIRIDRESGDGQEKRKRRPKNNRRKSYGTTQQEEYADERARLNASAPGPGKLKDVDDRQVNNDSPDSSPGMKASFQSDETLRQQEKDNGGRPARTSYLKSPYWWAGIIMMTIGETGNFLAYGFAPASIVSPLGVVALISNCLIAPFMLKERFRKRDFWGVLIAVGGAVTVVLSAKQAEKKLDQNALWDYIRRWEFLAYVLITLTMIAALAYASPRYGDRTILIDLGLVGLSGAYTVLSTKGIASLLSGSLWNAFAFPITYVLVLILALSAVVQIRYLNRGLQRFDSTQVIPVQFVLFTISVILGSAVLYRDFESTTADRALKFVAGCLLTFFGVYLITSGRKKEDGSDTDDEDDQDETIRLIDAEANEDASRLQPPRRLSHSQNYLEDDLPSPLRHETPSTSQKASRSSSRAPSIVVTPAEESTPEHTEWRPATEDIEPPSTPKAQITRSLTIGETTPFFTPSSVPNSSSTIRGPLGPSFRASTTGVIDTPTRGKRSTSPTKDLSPQQKSLLMRSARGSISRLLPGPLMPPLSSSLSAVIAESLLRGEGSPRSERATLRRLRISRRRRSVAAPEDIENRFIFNNERPLLVRQGTADTMPDFDTPSASAATQSAMNVLREDQRHRADNFHIGDDDGADPRYETNDDQGVIRSRLRAMSETLSGMIGGFMSRTTSSSGNVNDNNNSKQKQKDSRTSNAGFEDGNSSQNI